MPIDKRFTPYRLVLFDMDGVITSEEAYFTAAALTVYESLLRREGESSAAIQARWREIRRIIFQEDRTIVRLKNLAVNTNWDLAFLVYLVAASYREKFAQDEALFEFVCRFFERTDIRAPELYAFCAELYADRTGADPAEVCRLGRMWRTLQDRFQGWYLGDALFQTHNGRRPDGLPGKPGLIAEERPIVPLDGLLTLLDAFRNAGMRLGVATGRPYEEIYETLQTFGIYDRFDPDAFVTFTDITAAERKLRESGVEADLSKPHPYIFLQGAFGKSYESGRLVAGDYPSEQLNRVLAVGDALSDLYAAKDAGMAFAAVMTGIAGRSGRGPFQRAGADFILGSVLDFMSPSVC